MASQSNADKTLAFHQDELLKNKNISYIAVVPKPDKKGDPTDDFIIEVGVFSLANQIDAQEKFKSEGKEVLELVPRSLKIPSNVDSTKLSSEVIEVEIREANEFRVQSFTDRRRPANGGSSVSNYRYNAAGTLGGVIKLKNDSKVYFLSNWHVLTGAMGRNGDAILQPGRYDGGSFPGDIIATLYWSQLNSYMDAAIAHVPDINNVTYGTRCFGMINGLSSAQVGMSVKKCGRTTEATYGTVRSINATVNVNGYPSGVMTFRNQILTTHMSQAGDSGSLLLESGNRVVGLLFAGDGSTLTIHNHIGLILGGNLSSSIIKHPDGSEEVMPDLNFSDFG